MKIRLAEIKDIDQLIKMRWDFTLEDDVTGRIKESDYHSYYNECQMFLINAINGNDWYIWVIEINEVIVSHIYVEIIQKVPRPGRITRPFAFMTNVYTVNEYRGNGIGSKLLGIINEWVDEMKYEFVIVWPGEQSINFYKKNDYNACREAMEYYSK